MEHIIQFAVGIDDNAIVKRVEATAEKAIIETLTNDVRSKIFYKGWGKSVVDPDRDPLNTFAKDIIEKEILKEKEAIVERAAEMLVEKPARTKIVKEMVQNVLSEMEK